MLKFIVREVIDGGCTQFSYADELELGVLAASRLELWDELQRQFGRIVATGVIPAGAWRGGVVVQFDSGRWVRIKRAA
jgi:hypothetical protein